MEIHILKREPNVLRFLISDIDVSLVNSLRRIMIAEVPTMAIDDVIIIENSSPMKDEILADMRSLKENPQRFPAYENQFITDMQYRKMLSAKRYLILYEVTADTVYVDYIVDCRQDYGWLLK